MKPKSFLVFYKDSKLKEHRQVLNEIKRVFGKNKLKASFCKRSKFNKKLGGSYDLVLSVGGDGTLLRAAHSAQSAVIFGINSNRKKSEGALCSATIVDLKEKTQKAIEGNFVIRSFARARISFKNKSKSYDALNEVYVGSAISYITSRYSLKFGKIKEKQKSSGIIASTGLGSTAWYSSSARESFSPENNELRFIVREPYRGRLSAFNLKKGSITGKQKLSLKLKMANAVAAIDSIIKIPLDYGQEVQIGLSPNPARFAYFA